MPTLSRRTVAALAAPFGLLAALGFAIPGRAVADDTNIVQALRAGGFVIVVRHGATFPDQADTDPLNFDNIAAQRNLNDKGKALAKAFGDAIRQVHLFSPWADKLPLFVGHAVSGRTRQSLA